MGLESGHSGASARYKAIKENIEPFVFILKYNNG